MEDRKRGEGETEERAKETRERGGTKENKEERGKKKKGVRKEGIIISSTREFAIIATSQDI